MQSGLHIKRPPHCRAIKIQTQMRKALKVIFICAVVALCCLPTKAQTKKSNIPIPEGTYMFAERDTCKLFMDIYEPEKGTTKFVTGREKPTVIFMFGGGFIRGSRADGDMLPVFGRMRSEGIRVVSIDYRLGLKGQKGGVGIGNVDELDNAIHMAVEDLYSATEFILSNAGELGINPDNLVLMGSSAGAISVLQAEYELCNRREIAGVLPDSFRYKGVISLAGAILSRDGSLKYNERPCPMLLFHGTKDKVVNYKQIKVFKLGWFGSNTIASVCRKQGYEHSIYRFEGSRHEIADSAMENLPVILDFLETNVTEGVARYVDATVVDPRIRPSDLTLDSLYEGE